jgi:hypothetical protein
LDKLTYTPPQTLRLTGCIDKSILWSYYERELEGVPSKMNPKIASEYASRMLEVLDVATDGDGEALGQKLITLVQVLEACQERPLFNEDIFHQVLVRIGNGSEFPHQTSSLC